MKTALIYCRVSTEEQAKSDHFSLGTQLKLCEQAIEDSKEYRLADDGIYKDPGRSATNMSRPGLQDMLLRVEEDKKVGAVFVQDTDRLARNASDHLMMKALLRKHGVKLVSVSQPGLEDTVEGNLMDLVIAGMNEFQSKITARKTMKSLERKFEEGGWPTGVAIGYTNVAGEHGDKHRTVVIDPDRAPFITAAFKMYATGDYSVIQVRDAITKQGFRTRSGKQLAHSKMTTILQNHFYYGEMRWRGLVGQGKHEPLIDQDTFDRCQLVGKQHRGNRCKRGKFNFVLRGFVFCGLCGYRYTAEHHPKKNKSYYHCSHHGNRKLAGDAGKCADRYVEVQHLEEQVQSYFDKIQFSEDFLKKVESRLNDVYRAKRTAVSESKKRLEKMREALEQKLAIAEEKLISGILDDESFSRLKARYREQIEGVDSELFRLERSKNIKVDVIQEVLALVRNIGATYKKAPLELQRLYLSLFWERFEAENRLITKATKTPIVGALEAVGAISYDEAPQPQPSQYQQEVEKLDLEPLGATTGNRTLIESSTSSSVNHYTIVAMNTLRL